MKALLYCPAQPAVYDSSVETHQNSTRHSHNGSGSASASPDERAAGDPRTTNPLATPPPPTAEHPFTLNALRAARGLGLKIPMLTCYDYTTATLMQAAGVAMLLVGDSAASVVLGHASTLPVTLDFLIQLTAGVRRGARGSMVVGDMPFGSHNASPAQGVRNVVRMIKETDCDMVKIEASRSDGAMIRRLADAGVAVMAHVGLRPQSVGLLGGYATQGKTAEAAEKIIVEIAGMVHAGAAAVLLEAVPNAVSAQVVTEFDVPVIGCGGGPACDGHVVVWPDLLGITPRQPRFVPKLDLNRPLIEVARQYVNLVSGKLYPAVEHCYTMPEDEAKRLRRSRNDPSTECLDDPLN